MSEFSCIVDRDRPDAGDLANKQRGAEDQRRLTSGADAVAVATLTDEQGEVARVEPLARRIRALVAGETLLDTTRGFLRYQRGSHPHYSVPLSDFRTSALRPADPPAEHPDLGAGFAFDLHVDKREPVPGAVRGWNSLQPDGLDSPLVELDWDAADEWFEEEVRQHFHARDPYRRIDVLPSSRHVRVEVSGVTIGESTRPTLVCETGLPARWYLPPADVELGLLVPSTTETGCQYKGLASYWDLKLGETIHEDFAWTYPTAFPEAGGLANLIALYAERADTYVDGTLQARPEPSARWLNPSLRVQAQRQRD